MYVNYSTNKVILVQLTHEFALMKIDYFQVKSIRRFIFISQTILRYAYIKFQGKKGRRET